MQTKTLTWDLKCLVERAHSGHSTMGLLPKYSCNFPENLIFKKCPRFDPSFLDFFGDFFFQTPPSPPLPMGMILSSYIRSERGRLWLSFKTKFSKIGPIELFYKQYAAKIRGLTPLDYICNSAPLASHIVYLIVEGNSVRLWATYKAHWEGCVNRGKL